MGATRAAKIGGVVVGLAVVAGVAFMLGSSSVDRPKKASPTEPTAPAGTDLVPFRDGTAGWTISYPTSWTRLAPRDSDVALVVSEKPVEQNSGGSILARNITLAGPVDDANLAAAREITDGVVTGEGIEHLTEAKTLHQAGLPGYFYFYRFRDPASGQTGVHSHYFLFKGTTMISFVFQALPDADFARLADLYDRVIASFRPG